MNLHNFDQRDRKILVSAGVLFLASILLLLLFDGYIAGFLHSTGIQQAQVGVVQRVSNDVRRRPSTEFSWSQLKKKGAIHKGDTIFTGDDSEAIIVTEQGDEIVVAPNSLVVLNTERETLSINIGFGSVEGRVKAGQKILVSAKDKTTELKGDGSVVRVDAGDGERLLLKVVSGQLNVKSATGSENLNKDEVIEVGENLTAPRLAQITNIAPLASQRFKYAENGSVEFRWKASRPISRAKLKVATDPLLQSLVIDLPVTGDSHVAFNLPPDQRLYWQIIAEGGQSEVGDFWVIGDNPPTPLLPRSGDQLFYSADLDGSAAGLRAELKWGGGSPARKYLVQVATQYDFSKVEQEFRTTENFAQTKNLKSGEYFWRVRSLEYPNAPWSAIAEFRITPKPTKQLSRPLILAKATYYLETKPHSFSAAELLRLSPRRQSQLVLAWPELSWADVPRAKQFELQISSEPTFKTQAPIKVTSTSHILRNIIPGKYFWRVRAISDGYIESPYSEVRQFTVAVTAPVAKSSNVVMDDVTERELINTPPPPFELSWTPTVFSQTYEVQFSKNSDFKSANQYLTSSTQQKVQVPTPGTYYWRVRSLNKSAMPISTFSDVYSVSYERIYRDPASAKILMAINPRQDHSIIYVGKGSSQFMFEWNKPFPKAVYELQLSYDPNFKVVAFSTKTKSNYYYYQQPFAQNTAYWRVRAITSEKLTEWTVASKFNISYEPKPFDFETSEMIYASRQKARDRQQELLIAFNRQMAKLRSPASVPPTKLSTPQIVAMQKVVYLDANFDPNYSTKKLTKLNVEKHMRMVKNPPLLSWEKVPSAERYFVEISFQADFKNKVLSAPTPNPYYLWDTVRPGQFYWRVIAYNDRFLPSEYSAIQTLQVQVAPVAIESSNIFASDRNLNLRWTPSLFAKKYEVLFSDSESLTNAKSVIANENSLILPPPYRSDIYWKARPLNEHNIAIATWSDVQRLQPMMSQKPEQKHSRMPATELESKAGR